MSSRMYYLVISSNPEDIQSKFRDRFDAPEMGKIIESSQVLFRLNETNKFSGYVGEGTVEKDSIWHEAAEDIDRVVEIAWNDTSSITYGTLYKIRDGESIKVDHEYGDLHPFFGDEAEDLDIDADLDKPDFQAHSHVPAYFFRVHGLKIFDKYPEERSKIEFKDTYSPDSDSDVERTCPSCESHKISLEEWKAECEDCGYRNTEVWFSQYSVKTTRLRDSDLTRKNSSSANNHKQNSNILDKLLKVLNRND